MPNRDKTGPLGKGPRTGRGQGDCGKEGGTMRRPRRGWGRGFSQALEEDRQIRENEEKEN